MAGSQLAWATFLFVPVGALLLARRLAWARARLGAGRPPLDRRDSGRVRRWRWRPPPALAATGAAFRVAYQAGDLTGLPGAEAIRVTPEQAAGLTGA